MVMTHARSLRFQWFAVLILILVAAAGCLFGVSGNPTTALALSGDGMSRNTPYIVDTSQTVDNPFPDKLSPELVAQSSDPNSDIRKNMASALYLEMKDGSVVEVGAVSKDVLVPPYDLFRQYNNQVKSLHYYYAFNPCKIKYSQTDFGLNPYESDTWKSVTPWSFGAENGNDAIQLKPEFTKQNGVDMPNPISYITFKDLQTTQYFEIKINIPEHATQVTSGGFPVGVYKAGGFTFGKYYSSNIPVTATFHPVKEADYRAAQNLSSLDPITERSHDAEMLVPDAFTKLDLTDIGETTTTDNQYLLSSATTPYFKPYLTPETSESNADIPKYSELISRDIPGYVYVADDIDKPADMNNADSYLYKTDAGKGNHYLTMAWADNETQVYDRHYYLLYRPLPAPVVITKTATDSDTPVFGAHFSLMRVNDDNTTTEIAADLTTNEQGQIVLGDITDGTSTLSYAELREQAATADAFNPDTQTYTINEKIYLTPGTYTLHETKAPEGYIAGEDVTFSVEALTDSVEVTQVHVTNDKAATRTAHYIDVHDSNKTSDFTPADGVELTDHTLTITGEANKPYDATDKAWDYASAGYVLAEEDDAVLKGDALTDGDVYIYLKHATSTEQKTKTITRTITLVDEAGKPLSVSDVSVQNPTKQTVTYTYTETTDKVTGKTTQSTPTSDANTWAAFSAPQVTGYTPTPATLSQKTVAFGDADVDVNIVYTKDTPTKFTPDNQQQQERQAKETIETPSNVPDTGDEMPLGMIGLVGLCALTGVLVAARKQ